MIWWLKIACHNHGFAEGGFERCLARIGPVMKPIGDILDRLGHEIQDDGPLPEMERLAQKLEEARDIYGGCGRSWPNSREESDAQTERAHLKNFKFRTTNRSNNDADCPLSSESV